MALDHGVVEARVANALDALLGACEGGDFERARDAVPFWQDALSDEREPPAFAEALASAVADALDLARDASKREDSCHIAIVWPHQGVSARFRFDTAGAGDELSEIVRATVRRALTGAAMAELEAAESEAVE
jgi:hypothetical protein